MVRNSWKLSLAELRPDVSESETHHFAAKSSSLHRLRSTRSHQDGAAVRPWKGFPERPRVSIFVELPPARYCATAFAAFDPAGGFSIGNARAMMWFSQLAYEIGKRATIDAIAPRWGFAKVTVFVKRKIAANSVCGTRGLIGERSDAVVLAFSGTDPVVWEMHATNLNIRLSQDCDTHSGFKSAIEAARDEIERAVELCRDGGKPLFVAGHSLGAALAVLAAQQADRLPGGTPRGVYVYGMPRVGGERFRDEYNARLGDITYRLVHGDDIVACIPFSGIGFRHVGRMLTCASGEKFAAGAALSDHGCDAPQLADPHRRLVNGIRGLFAGEALPGPGGLQGLAKAFPKPFRDHLQDRYFCALAE
jgi:triacylglycerol lipase